MIKLEAHPYADCFPLMREQELKSLSKDIRDNGLLQDICLYQGQILDGRNRYQACLNAKVKPRFCEFQGTDEEALNAVVSWNLERRNLTLSQKAAIAVSLLPNIEAISKAKMQKIGKLYGISKQRKDNFCSKENNSCSRRMKSSFKASELMGIGSRNVEKAKMIKKVNPDLYQEIKNGKITVTKAEKKIKKAETERIINEMDNAVQLTLKQGIKVEPGDVWQLGRHTLHCCNSVNWEPPVRAKMAFADPPYNAGVADWDKAFLWRHDWLEERADYVFVTPGTANLAVFSRTTEMRYRWTYTHWLCNAIASPNDWGISNTILVMLFSNLNSLRLEKYSDFHKAIVNMAENNATQHPGRKPSSLLVWLIEIVTQKGDVIIDPFLGSGTTLLAAEKLNRVCYGAELNPQYCQEIIARWQALVPDGKPLKIKSDCSVITAQ